MACVMRAVFNKACRLTSSARNQASVGEMTNLISNDTERIFFGVLLSQQLWVGLALRPRAAHGRLEHLHRRLPMHGG